MRLKLTLERPDGRRTDIVVTADAAASVADVAAAMANGDPLATPETTGLDGHTRTLQVHASDGAHQVVPAQSRVHESALRPGAVVSVVDGEDVDPARSEPVAFLRIVAGPDAGTDIPLRAGANEVGRGPGCGVRLQDPLVSTRHARIHVGDSVEIVDLGSANGVVVGEGLVQRALLQPGQTATLGTTVFEVVGHRPPERDASAEFGPRGFNRSPRLAPRYEGERFLLPDPPQRPHPYRLPVVALIMPLVLSAALFAITRSAVSVAFVAMSPLLIFGAWWENRGSGRRQHADDVREFQAALGDTDQRLRQALAEERQARLAEHPSTAECMHAMAALDPLLWTRRPGDGLFLSLRLGTADQATRQEIRLPGTHNTTAALWNDLERVHDRNSQVSGVPVVADLRDSSVGAAGPDGSGAGMACALVTQLVTLHSPAEVVLTAVASTLTSRRWEWLKWLPHVNSPQSPLAGEHLASSPGGCVALVASLEGLIDARRSGLSLSDRPAATLPAVVVLVEDDAPVERSRLVDIAETGTAVGVHVIWCAEASTLLPAACRTWVAVRGGSSPALASFARTGTSAEPVAVESLDAEQATVMARGLSGVTDAGAGVQDASDLPRSVSFLALAGSAMGRDPAAVLERWRESGSAPAAGEVGLAPMAGSLRALVGQTGGDQFQLDLRADGPHALVGGTTGAGKSEFLQSWVLGMATAHSPRRVTFLLVDYKGGSAFSECMHLPHCVGLVTDLGPHGVRRALTSLNAELRYRERLLSAKDAKDLAELESRGDPDAPPSLVIIVDEFAALVQEVPEFVDGVVNVAQRGRSLGLHLILATQRPAGVIKGNLRANTNLRVALRMADDEDSLDVIRSVEAAAFDPEIPGRAVARTGPGRLVHFQAAYAGGRTPSEPPPPAVAIEELVFGRGAVWRTAPPSATGLKHAPPPTDIERVVTTVRSAATMGSLPTPRKPWLPELACCYDLARLPSPRTDQELVLGVADDAAGQAQPPFGFVPDRDGNMAIFGTGGSGKSLTLRTVAVAAALSSARGGPCQVFGLDFGAGGLRMLEDLPHVGSVVRGDDRERIVRLLLWLRHQVEERSTRFAQVRAGSIGDYRRLANQPDEPRLLLLLDGISAFRDLYEYADQSGAYQAFQAVVLDGRQVGVHVVVTADHPSAVSSTLGSAIQRRLVLRLADEHGYGVLGVPGDVLTSTSPAGRGLLGNHEVQVAVLGGTVDVAAQAHAISELARAMDRAGVARAPEVRRLPDRVRLSELPDAVQGLPAIGISSATLEAVGFDPVGTFLVAGPPASGRTTTLATLVSSIQRWEPKLRLNYFGKRRSPLHAIADWGVEAMTADEAAEAAQDLVKMLRTEEVAEHSVVVVLESVSEFLGTSAEMPLQDLIRLCRLSEQIVLAEGETTSLTQSWPLLNAVKVGRRGVCLQPDQADGEPLFRTAFPRVNRADFVPGRGLLVDRGRAHIVQVAVPE